MPSATATSVAAQCIADGPALDVASVISPISLRSTWWEPDGVKSLGIGFNLRDIAATKLCLKPRCDCGMRAGRQQLFGNFSGLSGLPVC